MPYGVVIRQSDGKCRAVDEQHKPLTGWLKDSMSVYCAMLKKQKKEEAVNDRSNPRGN